jgi:hypothetical protein
MRKLIRPCLLALTVAAFVVGCGNDSNPRAVDIKPDTRLKRIGEGGVEPGKANQNSPALPP